MPQRKPVSEFISRGVAFEAHEAVAVVQQLIAAVASGSDELTPPFGPPTLDTVEIGKDGAVVCPHCGVTPAVSEIGAPTRRNAAALDVRARAGRIATRLPAR
jgi:hypothetical protein